MGLTRFILPNILGNCNISLAWNKMKTRLYWDHCPNPNHDSSEVTVRSLWFTQKYCGWLRNPAPPKGCLKPLENHGINDLSTGDSDFAGPSTELSTAFRLSGAATPKSDRKTSGERRLSSPPILRSIFFIPLLGVFKNGFIDLEGLVIMIIMIIIFI